MPATAPSLSTSTTAPTAPSAAASTAVAEVQRAFRPTPGYLNAATLGLPPAGVRRAMREALTEWEEGRASATAYDEHVQGARTAYASLVGVPQSWVAVGSQTSVFAGTLAAALPDGAEVL
ncbi:MAG TPA: aminotransferase, partial [Segeticoccus sp.]|nr:aminotransferase [Segeticoccus sp.]